MGAVVDISTRNPVYSSLDGSVVDMSTGVVFETIDADAQAFFTTWNITDATEKTAVNNLVLDLKLYSLWTLCHQILPLCFNDATKNRGDLKGTYAATMFGGITHASRYVQGNGTTGYIATGINDNTVSSLNSSGVSFWCNNNVQENIYCFGAFNGVNVYNVVNPRNTLNEARAIIHDDGTAFSIANSNGDGFITFVRTTSVLKSVYRNGVLISNIASSSSSKVNLENYFLKANYVGAGYSTRPFQMLIQHTGFDATQAANLNTCVSTFRSNLGL